MMEEFYLRDSWRMLNQDSKEYSWFKGLGSEGKASRIDFALISRGLDQQLELIQYISSVKTDHRAVYMVINFNEFERGSGYWKF